MDLSVICISALTFAVGDVLAVSITIIIIHLEDMYCCSSYYHNWNLQCKLFEVGNSPFWPGFHSKGNQEIALMFTAQNRAIRCMTKFEGVCLSHVCRRHIYMLKCMLTMSF